MLHLKKLAVGIDSVDHMIERQKFNFDQMGQCATYSRNHPREKDALIGGSLYWIIKGAFGVRQEILGFEDMEQGLDEDGKLIKPHCRILLSPDVIAVRRIRHRAFQGWRYLQDDDTPADILRRRDSELSDEMEEELNNLGLL